jgi:hypothetical protein
MVSNFWVNNPSILLNKKYIIELWPSNNMDFEEKLNAITRFVILLTILGFIFTKSENIIFIGIITLIIIVILFYTKKERTPKGLEAFTTTPTKITDSTMLDKFLKKEYEPVNKKNPLNNVLLTEIYDSPNRRSAPPSFQPQVYEDINTSTKKMIQQLNPTIENTNKQLFGGLGEKFEFDQSMQQYYSTPNTKIPNDQGAYANYLYGDMPSCKEGDAIACIRDNGRYNLY